MDFFLINDSALGISASYENEQISSSGGVIPSLPLESELCSIPEDNGEKKIKKKHKSPFYTPMKKVTLDAVEKEKVADVCQAVNRNMFLRVRSASFVYRCHFVKNVFSTQEMENLLNVMKRCDYWQARDDARGVRETTITGMWAEQGHSTPVYPLHPAGVGGKSEECMETLNILLRKLAKILEPIIERKRPDVYEVLREHGLLDLGIGMFHLFMSPIGSCRMHKDKNDFLSVVVGITTPAAGGALEIGGSGYCFNIRCGDILILDSDSLYHGSRHYSGTPEERVVGIFILHRSVLRLKNVPKEDLEREKFVDRTLPCIDLIQSREKKRKRDLKKEARKKKRAEGKFLEVILLYY